MRQAKQPAMDPGALRPLPAGVSVVEQEGRIVLSGTVASLAEKRRTVLRFRRMEAGSEIVDALRIRPIPARTDQQIAQRMRDALEEDASLRHHAPDLRIQVADGVVTLDGALDALAKKRLAGLLAWWCAGVQDVHNQIRVVPPDDDNDAELIDAVRTAFLKDKTLQSDGLAIQSRDGVVRLSGTARSAEERAAAEENVWAIEGVQDVINGISVVPFMP